jgi:hypothetical protein
MEAFRTTNGPVVCDPPRRELDPSYWLIDDGLVGPTEVEAFSRVLLDDLKGLAPGM